MNFFDLSAARQPLLLGNVWDAASAQLAQKLGYRAIGTSSAAMAASLGYEDGEGMSFDELLFLVKRIRACSSLPLTVDIEAGYGNSPAEIANNIVQLLELGVSGINIEDSRVMAGERQLLSAAQFAAGLSALCVALGDRRKSLFINVRTDTYLLQCTDTKIDTLSRAALYQSAGADGLFVPCLTEPADIAAIVAGTALPLNLMCMPELPDFARLAQLGVKRISMGNAAYQYQQQALGDVLAGVKTQDSFAALYSRPG